MMIPKHKKFIILWAKKITHVFCSYLRYPGNSELRLILPLQEFGDFDALSHFELVVLLEVLSSELILQLL